MAEASRTSAASGAGGEQQSESQARSPLESSKGRTAIDDSVVTKVASVAAREVRGVHELGGSVARAVGSVTQRVGIADERSQGVSVEVGEREAAVDLSVVIDFGESIPRVTEAIRANVIRRIEGITGLTVTEVNVSVNDLYFPGDETAEPARVQ
ncbi:Asp23/Gls24 family envelope stress response protein [Conexibacter arvalis]|uniref:Putative alkaline shock family protein YloU n=1 Tax=Conexibacter arvalis TaxID=912552 RepID=A0A840I6K4_9ACTN|nr:Asp23/Gls24 family envelope stress response protein [Conexibacter arvalis]MBB4660477.1 putative alkaline shock family protein YloU [Conexibacter arvalis]